METTPADRFALAVERLREFADRAPLMVGLGIVSMREEDWTYLLAIMALAGLVEDRPVFRRIISVEA